jgi:hypothetical protein
MPKKRHLDNKNHLERPKAQGGYPIESLKFRTTFCARKFISNEIIKRTIPTMNSAL